MNDLLRPEEVANLTGLSLETLAQWRSQKRSSQRVGAAGQLRLGVALLHARSRRLCHRVGQYAQIALDHFKKYAT